MSMHPLITAIVVREQIRRTQAPDARALGIP